MAKTADISSKRLIGLAPTTWARWLTGEPMVEAREVLSGEFQWVSRATDVLLKASSPERREFLIANEIQFRPDRHMPRRIRAYAALAEERYGLDVYPVVVNILPPKQQGNIPDQYHSEFMGLIAHQDYRVFNLWEVEAELVLSQHWATLLPFVPILKGGDDKAIVQKALAQLRADEQLADMETFLALFATFVMTPEEMRNLMRWDMAMLRESPWYNEILEEGLELGEQKGVLKERLENLLLILRQRFGSLPYDLTTRLYRLDAAPLRQLLEMALTAPSLEVVMTSAASLPAAGNGHESQGQA